MLNVSSFPSFIAFISAFTFPINHRNPLTAAPHAPPPHEPQRPQEPLGGLDSYFRLYICLCVCMYVSRHHGHTVQVRDFYFWIYILHIDEKKVFWIF